MFEQDYMDADYEVIQMVNRKRGPGGQLPRKAVTFIPQERAKRVEAMDRRIEKIRKAMPWISVVASSLIGLIVGMNL